ncbi:MAG: RNA-guided pseudouridylation complex pseudouridine synthase subunit Cbf5 [Euryarchaeota archaeon]|nr:RNA-guided pseudouridylation complex pseudouridine synthase subunit Cbf5 [Euryarchaeota archaeon]
MTNQLPFEKKGREILIKAEESTDPKYGCPPENRAIEEHIKKGVINLDKPRGPTSHEVVAWVKRILSLKKAGHGGTLDPNVSGVLPTALEDATKVIQTLLSAGKEYICVMHLHEHASEASIKEVCREFTGTILQKPPIRAAVKRQIRPRKIYYIDVLEIIEKDVLLRVGCEAGTYLRKLTHDVGEALGVSAHMAELRRTQTGPFKEDETLTKLHELMDSYHFWKEDGEEKFLKKIIQPLEKTVQHLPRVTVRDSAVDAICHGAHLAVPGILQAETGIKRDDFVAVFTLKNELISLGRSELTTDQIIELNKGIAIRTERVIMLPGTYPRMWGK